MDETRIRYLEAMGITPWVTRGQPAGASAATDSPVAGETAPETDSGPVAPAGAIGELGWAALRARVRDCRDCALHQGRTQAVFGVGPEQSDWMIVGEGPGAEEDRKGEPFVGRAGQLLDGMLEALGLSRKTAYIANVVKCRPPENRDPKPEEAAACAGYLDRQIELLQPRLILAVGRVAAQRLLATDSALGKLREQVHRYGPRNVPVVVTYHPAYLLRRPGEKRKVWRDLLFAERTVRAGS
jgi:DNA polymerase